MACSSLKTRWVLAPGVCTSIWVRPANCIQVNGTVPVRRASELEWHAQLLEH